MGKYKSLISNTLLFGLSTFSSKLLVFFLMRFYTSVLSTGEYGVASIIVTTSNLILPMMYFSISEAIIRFGLDKANRKSDVYTTGILCIVFGYFILWCFRPLLGRIENISGYLDLIYLYVLASSFRTVTTHFVRSLGMVRLFALDGIITSATTIGFNILFLLVFEMGVTGFVLSTIAADAISGFGLFFILKLHRFFRPGKLYKKTARAMLRYSIPLVPTAVFWWVINASDQYFITSMISRDVNGLYAAASKVPGLITAISAFFIQAWQISAFTEYRSKEGERFYSTVFNSYYTFIFLAASGLILLVRPITGLYVAPEYYEGWKFMPWLILAVSFSCLVTFLGTIYNAAKKNAMVTITTAFGAVANLILNYLLIPKYGGQGAAFATFFSFFMVFMIRVFDTRKYMRLSIQPVRLALNLSLLLAQIYVSLFEVKFGMFLQVVIFIALLVCNLGLILFIVRKFMGQLYLRSHKARGSR